ncbi:hypothetical protein B0H21DRAFT_746050 [Amylocystis lapponica]|nr:hypothetical protein B0H21DRAFT_746050 [Amylocystis lapponica]
MAGALSKNASRGFGFWGTVAAVMVALKMKDRWDEYRAVPSEDGLGPVALRSPMPVRVNGEEMGVSGDGFLDTEIPRAKRLRKQANDCCVCCGMRCGLFFGIVCLMVVVWQIIDLVLLAVKPYPTGLEGMPKFSTSLGCTNAQYLYNSTQTTILVPISAEQLEHELSIAGGAVGTVTIVQGDPGLTEVKYELTIRTDEQSLLNDVVLAYPTLDVMEDDTSSSRLLLTTPVVPIRSGYCMRYDVTLYLPPNLRKMNLQARSAAQIKFDRESNFDLESLFVITHSTDDNSMVLPHSDDAGWLVGNVPIVSKTTLTTQRGDAVLNVHVHPTASSAEPPLLAELLTTTGAGRSDVFYENDKGHPHRRITSAHRSSRNGDVYLYYAQAEFSGLVDLSAKSYSAKNLQGGIRPGGPLPWVGDKDGEDRVVVNSGGWVGMYF